MQGFNNLKLPTIKLYVDCRVDYVTASSSGSTSLTDCGIALKEVSLTPGSRAQPIVASELE